jgi:hypothetical protein
VTVAGAVRAEAYGGRPVVASTILVTPRLAFPSTVKMTRSFLSKDSAKKSARLIKGAKEIYYPGAPHGLTATHQDQVNRDLLVFLGS